MFALDLLCIQPFADGNGRVARLATAHLLQRTGYGVGKYVSVEQLIYETKDDYYLALAASTLGWFDDGQHSAWPWVGYLLGRLDAAYTRFGACVAAGGGGTKQARVRDFVLLHAPTPFTIADIRRTVPGRQRQHHPPGAERTQERWVDRQRRHRPQRELAPSRPVTPR